MTADHVITSIPGTVWIDRYGDRLVSTNGGSVLWFRHGRVYTRDIWGIKDWGPFTKTGEHLDLFAFVKPKPREYTWDDMKGSAVGEKFYDPGSGYVFEAVIGGVIGRTATGEIFVADKTWPANKFHKIKETPETEVEGLIK